MRQVGSVYESGRSPRLIKLKTSYGDREGIVVRISEDAVSLKLPNGILVEVPEDNVLIPTPSVGDVVTFSYESNARRDEPVNPKIYRIRTDLSWDDVLLNSVKEKRYLNEHLKTVGFTSRPPGYWTPKKMRLFMESFAKRRNMDPLRPETWHSIPFKEIQQSKSGSTIVRKYKGYYKALRQLFPDMKLDETIFPQPVWHDIANRRKFFEDYAKVKGFNPHAAEEWYSQNVHSIMSKKGAYRVISYHKNILAQALMDLFPNIGLVKSRFWDKSIKEDVQEVTKRIDVATEEEVIDKVKPYKQAPILWRDTTVRRKFFEDYAKEREFDPLIPSNWYSQPFDDIMSFRGATKAIYYHNNSIVTALQGLFPDVEFDRTMFPRQFAWHKTANRIQFFIDYAKERGFDPLVAENWYLQSRQKIMSKQGATSVISYHRRGVWQALLDLFPSIGLDPSQLRNRSLWSDPTDRRKFFEDYAKANGFDPLNPQNWYSQPREGIVSVKGAYSVLNYHKQTVSQALLDLFPDIGLKKSKLWDRFAWGNVENRKMFFLDYAKENGFDPNSPTHWYSQPLGLIMSVKGATSAIYYHNNNLTRALEDLFPDIGLDTSKLWDRKLWRMQENRRKFFENYANAHSFKSRSPEGWYSQPKDKLMNMKEILDIISYHNHSLSQALLDLFPDIGLRKSKLWDRPTWRDVTVRRTFFENYAKKNKFNPHIPENWYSQEERILAYKGAAKIIYFHKNLPTALHDLFPDIGIDISKFSPK